MIKKIMKGIFLIFIVFMILMYFLLDTKHGLTLGLSIAEKIIPGSLTVESVTGKLGSTFTLKNIRYHIEGTTITAKQLHLSWHWWQFLSQLNTPVNLTLNQLNFSLANQKLATLTNLSLKGDFSLNHQSKLHLNVNKTQYIASPTLTITIPQITGLITGNYKNYNLNTQLQTLAPNLPSIHWHIQAKGNTHGIEQLNLLAKLLNGSLTLTGFFNWLPHLNWQLAITGKHLQPSQTWASVAGTVQMHITSQGEIINLKPKMNLQINDISGSLMGHPILAKGRLSYQADNLTITHLSFVSDNNQLRANGYIANTANLTIHANLPQLGQLIPNMSGNANLNAIITGSGKNPHIKASASVHNLKMNDTSVEHVLLSVNGNAIAPKPLRIDLSANNINNQTQKIKSIKSTLTRIDNKFSLNSFVDADLTKFKLNASALAIKKTNQVKGNINELTLTHKNEKLLYLKTPIQFTSALNQLSVQPNCIYSTQGSTCIKQLTVQKVQDKLSGTVKLTANDFSYLTDLVPQIEKIKGLLNINMQLAGTTAKPILTGDSTFKGSVNIPYLKISLNPINLDLKGNENGILTYKASITSKTPLTIIGTTNLTEDFKSKVHLSAKSFEVINNAEAKILASPNLKINFDGLNLNINGDLQIPYAKITPLDFTSTTTLPSDVVFVGEKEKTPLNLNANINVALGDKVTFSYAGLLAKLGGAITILERPGGDTTAKGVLSVEKGQYKAYGQDLTIRKGKIIYTGGSITDPGLNIEAIRKVNIVNTASTSTSSGSYSSDKQVVGIRIQGSANAPKLVLFSEPSGLSQSDILSYLILGRGTGQAGSAGAGTLVSALSYLNIGDHAESSIKNQLDHSLGLDVGLESEEEYDADSGDVVNNTSLSLGKSISPKLSFSYSIGIVVPINILTITYKLTEKFSLKSEASSQGTGVDIFYHYSKD